MPQAIPIYVINLDRRPDRLERIAQHLETRGVAWERVSGCDGAGASEAALASVIRPRGPLGPLGVGDRACTVSHTLAWQRLVDGGASHALFLEDDVYLGSDLSETLAETDWIPAGAEAVKLEKYNAGSSRLLLGPVVGHTPGGRALRRMRSRHMGGGAYILSRKGAELVLGWRGRMRVPVDHFLFNDTLSPVMATLNPVITVPGMATQRKYAYDSDTASHNRAAMPKGWRRRMVTLQRGAFEVRRLPRQLLELATGRAALIDVAFSETPSG